MSIGFSPIGAQMLSPVYTQAAGSAGAVGAGETFGAAAMETGAAVFAVPGTSADPALAQDRAVAKDMMNKFEAECQTCKNRKYQDGSDDMGVSFKTPGHIAPEVSASVVMSHEQEHVAHNLADAAAKGGKVLSQSVTLHSAICPECGKAYVAGGTTRSVISTPVEAAAKFNVGKSGHEGGQALSKAV